MSRSDAPLVPSDEGLNHQITDTFASVQQADRSWTEKVCLSVGRKDGSLQIGFGLGKYINRNIMDAYAGIARGVEEWVVRSSRQLSPTPDTTEVGPISYEVVEPLKKVRIRLAANDTQPIAFDVVLDCSAIPPFMENHEFRRQFGGYRTDNDLCRYHQVGEPSGWLEIDGERQEINPEDWYCSRDHSWGLRYGVGIEPSDIMPGIDSSLFPMNFLWSPMRFQRGDGSAYAMHHFYLNVDIPGVPDVVHGGIEHAEGSREAFAALQPDLQYCPETRRLLGGVLNFSMEDGSERPVQVEVMGDTGFHLGLGLYFGLDGHFHGEWRGEYHEDGEYIADTSEPDVCRRIHQIRDCIVRLRDGENIGWGNYQTVVQGEWAALGLTAEKSFI